MDKEIIELIKSLADGGVTLLIWYFVLDTVKFLVGWGMFVYGCFWFGRGFNWFLRKLDSAE